MPENVEMLTQLKTPLNLDLSDLDTNKHIHVTKIDEGIYTITDDAFSDSNFITIKINQADYLVDIEVTGDSETFKAYAKAHLDTDLDNIFDDLAQEATIQSFSVDYKVTKEDYLVMVYGVDSNGEVHETIADKLAQHEDVADGIAIYSPMSYTMYLSLDDQTVYVTNDPQ